MGELLHFEDFAVGQVIDLGSYAVTAQEIREFASEFDPQRFHLDEEAAEASLLGGLAASGWHVCAMFMRLLAVRAAAAPANRLPFSPSFSLVPDPSLPPDRSNEY